MMKRFAAIMWMWLCVVLTCSVMRNTYCLPLPSQETGLYSLVKGTDAEDPTDPNPANVIPRENSKFIVKISSPVAKEAKSLFQGIWDELIKKFPKHLEHRVTLLAQVIGQDSNLIRINTNPEAYAILVEIFAVGSSKNVQKLVGDIRAATDNSLKKAAGKGAVVARPVYMIRYDCSINPEVDSGEYLSFSLEDFDVQAAA